MYPKKGFEAQFDILKKIKTTGNNLSINTVRGLSGHVPWDSTAWAGIWVVPRLTSSVTLNKCLKLLCLSVLTCKVVLKEVSIS